MQKNSTRKLSVAATPILMVCCLLAGPSSARADDDSGKCSVKTLHGDYGFTVEGLLLTTPGAPLPPGAAITLRGVALTHFDGKGNLTQVDHIVVGGVSPAQEWTFGSGPYTVNPDCTGTAEIDVPGSPLPPVILHFVIVRQGKEIHTVVEANAVTSIGIKVD